MTRGGMTSYKRCFSGVRARFARMMPRGLTNHVFFSIMTVRIALKGLAARSDAPKTIDQKWACFFTHVNKGGTAEESLSSLESMR